MVRGFLPGLNRDEIRALQLKRGDEFISINGAPIASIDDLQRSLGDIPFGSRGALHRPDFAPRYVVKKVRVNWFTAARTVAHPFRAYSLAAFFVLVAAALQFLIQSWLGQTVFLLLYPVVFLAAWLLGTGPGIFASGLGALVAIYFFEPLFTFHAPSITEIFRVVIFFAAGSTLAFIIGRGRRAEARLRESERRFRLLVLALTHDLRTPLTAAKSNAELILKFPDRADRKEARQQVLARILASLQRVEKMIQDILDANRVETGERVSVSLRESDLSAALALTVDELRVIHGNRLVYEAQEIGHGFWGSWDTDALKRCVENLVNNAAKYGKPDSPIKVILTRLKRGVRIEVHNEGQPIPTKEQQRLFDAYHRSDDALNSGVRGWGIGLTLVKGLVEAHEGVIYVKSQEGFGTSFIIELPRTSLARSAA